MTTLTPGTFPGPTPYQSGLDLGPLTNAACGFISDARLRALCMAGTTIFGGGGGGTQVPQFPNLVPTSTCPPGYKPSPNGGCQLEGIAPYLPGDIGRQDYAWGAVNGRYGAGYAPLAVQRNVRMCPPGAKLGKDGVCYDRLARTNRAHNPGARPFLTGGEVNALRRAKRLQKRFARLRSGKGALFPSTTKRACAKGKKR